MVVEEAVEVALDTVRAIEGGLVCEIHHTHTCRKGALGDFLILSWNVISFETFDLTSTNITKREFACLFGVCKSYLYALIFKK